MNASLKTFAKDYFPEAKNDLFACFVERGYVLAHDAGYIAMVTMQSWMFLSSFQKMRERMLREKTLIAMAQIGYNSFPSMNSKIAQATVFALKNRFVPSFRGAFNNLNSAPQSADKSAVFLARDPATRFDVIAAEFKRIPGSPVAYWVSEGVRQCYLNPLLGSLAVTGEGLKTGENERFIRKWFEVDYTDTNLDQDHAPKWFQHTKGGGFRRWYGSCDDLLLYTDDGRELRAFPKASLSGKERYTQENISWGRITSGLISFRYTPVGSIPNMAGLALYPDSDNIRPFLGFLNSKCCELFLSLTNPTLNFPPGTISDLPVAGAVKSCDASGVKSAILIAKFDWDAYERSWDFQSIPLMTASADPTPTLESSYTAWITQSRETIAEMKRLEDLNS